MASETVRLIIRADGRTNISLNQSLMQIDGSQSTLMTRLNMQHDLNHSFSVCECVCQQYVIHCTTACM